MHLNEVPTTPATRKTSSEKIASALREVAFPITKNDLIAKLRDQTLDLGASRALLSDIVQGVPCTRFRHAQSNREVNTRWQRITKSLAAVEQLEDARR